MQFKLLEFEIHEVNGMTNIKFKVECDGKNIELDKMLRIENKEDRALLKSIETFIISKVVR